MLIFNEFYDIFIIDKSGVEILDPDPKLSLESVMSLYSGMYPELTTITVHGPEYREDKVVYRFKPIIETKRMKKRCRHRHG